MGESGDDQHPGGRIFFLPDPLMPLWGPPGGPCGGQPLAMAAIDQQQMDYQAASNREGVGPLMRHRQQQLNNPRVSMPFRWAPTPRPRPRHNAGRQQPQPPAQRHTIRLMLDWPEDEEDRARLNEKMTVDSFDRQFDLASWDQTFSDIFTGDFGGDNLTDITFIVQDDEDAEKEVEFQAHRLLLSLRSPVFKAMFFGPLRETGDRVRITDVSLGAFRAMLSFIYQGVATLTSAPGAWELWYVAKKYMLDALEDRCRKYLKSHLTHLNVLDTYSFAEKYGDAQVLYQCLVIIDRHARYILGSPGFAALSLKEAKDIVSRRTLNAKEVEVVESVVRWIQSEIERRLLDKSEGAVPDLRQIFLKEFKDLIRFKALSSQDFVHHVLPHGVLDNESIGEVASKIRKAESDNAGQTKTSLQESGANSDNSRNSSLGDSRLGLNQARDLLVETSQASDIFLRTGTVHTVDSVPEGERVGPGYYQLSRFSPCHELAMVWKWPREYTLKFRVSRPLFLLGACVTETDRQFYSPKVKYVLTLRHAATGTNIADGNETLIKKTSNKFEGGYPKALDYGPHDICFREVAQLNQNIWYELSLRISEELWSVCPLLVCKCSNRCSSFGVDFEFEPGYDFSKRSNNLETFKRHRRKKKDLDGGEGVDVAKQEDQEALEMEEEESGLMYGLISRLYFFY